MLRIAASRSPSWKRPIRSSCRSHGCVRSRIRRGSVRRSAIRAMAHVPRPDSALLFERALGDKDACVRYYALRGLSQIGVGRADQSVERRKRDDDVRVRLAAHAAFDGRTPQ